MVVIVLATTAEMERSEMTAECFQRKYKQRQSAKGEGAV